MESPANTTFVKNKPQRLLLDRNMLIIFGITLTAIMSVSSISPAFPLIVKKFNISPHDVGLLITVFTVPGVILTPVFGILADRWGRKTILVPSLILFSIAGTSCFFATDYHVLLILRFFQGIGAASLGSLNITLIGDLFTGKNRAIAMGYNASVLSIGTASYPAIGGLLATIGWSYPFLLPILATPVGMLVLFYLSNPVIDNDGDFMTYLRDSWKCIKNKKIIAVFLMTTIQFIILYGAYITYYPHLIGTVFGKAPATVGFIMSDMSLTTAATSSQMGYLTSKFKGKTLIQIAYIMFAIALILVSQAPNIWWLIIPTMIFGLGMGLSLPNMMNLLASLAPTNQRAAIMAFNGMVLRLGQTMGPVIIGGAFALWGTSGAFLTGAFWAVLGLGIISFAL